MWFEMKEVIRYQELARIAAGLAQGQWFVIYAPSGSGKTTFLAQLARRLELDYRVKYVNLRACSGAGLDEVYGYLAGELQRGSQARTALDLRQILLESPAGLVLLVDDAGALSPGVAGPFLNHISALESESRFNPALKNLRIILAASKDLRELSVGAYSCLNTLEELFLPDFTQEETRWLAGDDYETVWELAEGHPRLTACLLRNGFSLNRKALDWVLVQENTLLTTLKLRLAEDILRDYTGGRWVDSKLGRKLRILGLAKEERGELVVRNLVFHRIIEDWLTEARKRETIYLSLPGNSGLEVKDSPGRDATYVMGQGKLQLLPESKQVFLDGRSIELTPVEFRILEHLLRNSRQVVSRDSLAQAAFPHEPAPMTDVESHIKNLRRKLGDKAAEPRFIRSRRGFGYQAVENSFQIVSNI